MQIVVVGDSGLRKPFVAAWIRARYGLAEGDVLVSPVFNKPTSALVDLFVHCLPPEGVWPACPAPADFFRFRVPPEVVSSVYLDDVKGRHALDHDIGVDLDCRMSHFGLRPVMKGDRT